MIKRSQVHANRWLAGRVKRYHTWPTIQEQTTRDHSARVAEIYVEIWGMPRAEVLYWCLLHDKGEQFAGDSPFGGKTSVPGFREMLNQAEIIGLEKLDLTIPELTSVEYSCCKICDLLEMMEFCIVEQNLGNQYAQVMTQDVYDKALAVAAEIGNYDKVLEWINRRVR